MLDISAAYLYAYFHTTSFLQSYNPLCWLNYNRIKNEMLDYVVALPLHTVNSRIWNKQQNLKLENLTDV